LAAEERARFEQCKENLELYRQHREKIISLAEAGQKTEALTLMKGDAIRADRAAQSGSSGVVRKISGCTVVVLIVCD